jgi:1,4-alpha-glucan branching enzyme
VERPLAPASWGTGKDLSTWDSPAVSELAFAARRTELSTVAAAAGGHEPRAGLERAARELLAIQSSDWAFMVTRDLASDYPQRRVAAHEAAHAEALLNGFGEASLRNLAPDLELASILAP